MSLSYPATLTTKSKKMSGNTVGRSVIKYLSVDMHVRVIVLAAFVDDCMCPVTNLARRNSYVATSALSHAVLTVLRARKSVSVNVYMVFVTRYVEWSALLVSISAAGSASTCSVINYVGDCAQENLVTSHATKSSKSVVTHVLASVGTPVHLCVVFVIVRN